MEYIDTIIVGGGQAGLSTSYYLKRNGHEHLILEKSSQPANPWRNERWDSFTLVTPQWAFSVPEANFNESERDKFLSRTEVVNFFDNYIRRNNLPIRFNSDVLSIELLEDNKYEIKTNNQTYTANNVVIATGFWQKPKLPLSVDVPKNVKQLYSQEYRNPKSLPEGAVLIIGTGQSGGQIAEELYQNGRKVFLCTGRAIGAFRRYRGKDVLEWLDLVGFFNMTPEQLPPGMGKFDGIPHVSGSNGGHELNLHQFAKDGVILLGHLREIRGNTVSISPDLRQNLEIIDQGKEQTIFMVDDYVKANGLNIPEEEVPKLRNGYDQPIIEQLDLKKEGITSIIWAMGYTFDYSLVKLPVRDNDGFPIQSSGVTNYKGLYFTGIPWMPTQRSGFLLGVGESALYIASKITEVYAHH